MTQKKKEARTHFVALRLSKKELKAIKEKANLKSSPIGTFIRMTLNNVGVFEK